MYTPALHYGLHRVMIHLSRHESSALMGSEYLGVPMSVLSVPQLIGVLLFQCLFQADSYILVFLFIYSVWSQDFTSSRFLEMM